MYINVYFVYEKYVSVVYWWTRQEHCDALLHDEENEKWIFYSQPLPKPFLLDSSTA
jgi:hypothetical protein